MQITTIKNETRVIAIREDIKRTLPTNLCQ